MCTVPHSSRFDPNSLNIFNLIYNSVFKFTLLNVENKVLTQTALFDHICLFFAFIVHIRYTPLKRAVAK